MPKSLCISQTLYAPLDARGLVVARAVAFAHLDVSIAQNVSEYRTEPPRCANCPMVPPTKLQTETVPYT